MFLWGNLVSNPEFPTSTNISSAAKLRCHGMGANKQSASEERAEGGSVYHPPHPG